MSRAWTTQRLVLRQLTPADADAVRDYGQRAREFQRPWDPVRPPDYWDVESVAARLGSELDHAGQDRSLALYISRGAAPDVIIGRVALNNIVRGAFQSCSVGYGLEPGATGRGYMTEALTELVRIAFDDLKLHRIEANVIPRNTRSIAVAERCGFEAEGVSPRFLRIAGRWEDHLRMAKRNGAMEQHDERAVGASE